MKRSEGGKPERVAATETASAFKKRSYGSSRRWGDS
jgi:hypothetical protein